MKIYELRSSSEGDADALLDNGGKAESIEAITEVMLDPSKLFTSLERAKAAAEQDHEEKHVECLSQEEIDSVELLNVPDDLEWIEYPGVWEAESEALGMTWVIREHELSDPTN